MSKGVLIGGGLGLGLLGLLLGYGYLTSSAPSIKTSLPAVSATASVSASGSGSAPVAASTPQTAAQAVPPSPAESSAAAPAVSSPTNQSVGVNKAAAASAPATLNQQNAAAPGSPQKTLSPEERKKIREQLESKLAAFRAKGSAVTMADTKKFLDDMQALNQGLLDSRYFATMRQLVVQGEQVQNLSKELTQLASDQSPKANARRAAIMAEMRDSSDRISNGAKSLQSVANEMPKGAQK